jgi:Ca-activated chloride channel homolog
MSTLTEEVGFQLVHAETGKEVRLAMQRLLLVGKILPVGARLMVQHTFSSEGSKPLEVVYSFPLPRDAALRRFRVTGKGFSVHSQLKPVEEAVKAYEEGIQEGHLSTLVRQYRDGIVNLNLGNLRPQETVTVYLELLAGVELHDRGFRFRFPFTLAPGYHSKARTIAVDEGTGEIELPEDEFGDLILPQFIQEASNLHQVGFDLSVLLPQPITEVGSPSHAVRFISVRPQEGRVSLAQAHDVPNRDLVLDVRTKECLSGVLAGIDKSGKGQLTAVFTSETFGKLAGAPRRMVFVMDRSGSMEGVPIEQAKKAIEACLGALSDQDQFGLVVFDDQVESFKSSLVSGVTENRQALRRFLQGIDARGGTELARGFLEAASLLGKEGGDVMLLTDGQVMGTEDILERARPAGIRIHTLGIGSASQDRFLSLLSGQTGGVCRFLTPRERVDLPAVDLFASIGRPVATAIQVRTENLPGATILPQPPSMVFSGNPLVVFGETSGAIAGELCLEWKTGDERRNLVQAVAFQEGSMGDTLRLIRGARLITDLESHTVSTEGPRAAKKREKDRVSKSLEALSQEYGLASRQMALVAIVQREGDQSGQLPETRVVPVGMPQDVSFESYFSKPPASALYGLRTLKMAASRSDMMEMEEFRRASPMRSIEDAEASLDIPCYLRRQPEAGTDGNTELLLELASRIEPDGGMPGPTDEQRILATLLTLLFFVSEGHTIRSGAFRSHVQRLITFLKSAERIELPEDMANVVEEVREWISEGRSIVGDWSVHVRKLLKGERLDAGLWRKIDQALHLA